MRNQNRDEGRGEDWSRKLKAELLLGLVRVRGVQAGLPGPWVARKNCPPLSRAPPARTWQRTSRSLPRADHIVPGHEFFSKLN